MCRALGVEGYDDPRVATSVARFQHMELMAGLMDQCYAAASTLTSAEATRRFEAEHIPYVPILWPEELTQDPHALAVGLFEYQDHPVVGRVRLPRHPARFGTTPASLSGGSPTLGQHTDDILTWLGLADTIPDLRAAGAVA